MKIWLIFPALLFFPLLGIGQDLQPDDTNAVLNVSVIDFAKKPMSGEKISFTSKVNQKIYSGTTDSVGKFHLLMPKGAGYDVKYIQFTSEAAYNNTLTIPEGKDQLITFNYTYVCNCPKSIRSIMCFLTSIKLLLLLNLTRN